MDLVNKEDVIKLYEELLPWEKEELKDIFGTDFDSMSQEEILNHFGIDAIDFVTSRDVSEHFGRELLDDFCDYEILDEVEERLWRIDTSDLIDTLEKKLELNGNSDTWFTENDIERLEEIISKAKKELNTEEVLGTTVVIRDDDGDIQDGTYESWLTLHNTEFNLPAKTKFKEGDKVEIFARKTK